MKRPRGAARPAVSFRLAATVFVLSVVAATVLGSAYLAREQEEASELRDNRGNAMHVSVEALVESTNNHARALAGLFAASEVVNRDEFRAFADTIGMAPGMFGMGMIRTVPQEDLEEFEARLQREIPDAFVFEVEGIEQVPVAERPVHYVIDYFVSPDDLPAWGFDAASEPLLGDVVERALETTMPAASGFLTFPSTFEPDGFFILWPAYAGDGELIGVIALAMDLSDMLTAAAPNAFSDEVTVTVTDLNHDHTPPPPNTWSGIIDVADHEWRLDVLPRTPARGLAMTLAIFGVGSLAVFLVTMSVVLAVSRRRQRKELEELRRADTQKDDFLATVSHELRTPLTSIMGFADALLHSGDALGGETEEMISFISDEAAAMEGIVQDLLVASRLQQRNLVPIAVSRIDSMAALCHGLTDQMAAVRGFEAIVEGDGPVLADPARVRQILRNLIDNAVRHGRPPLRIDITDDGDTVHVALSDSGPGVPEEMGETLFSRYRSGANDDGQPRSTGIGLWLCRELADLMNGTLEHTGGSTFELTLPKATKGASAHTVPVSVPGR